VLRHQASFANVQRSEGLSKQQRFNLIVALQSGCFSF
jgi:hypothetical protein